MKSRGKDVDGFLRELRLSQIKEVDEEVTYKNKKRRNVKEREQGGKGNKDFTGRKKRTRKKRGKGN